MREELTVAQAYRKARGFYRVQRVGAAWRVLYWRRGLNCWGEVPDRLTYREAQQRRTQMIASTALIAMGIDERRTASLMVKIQRGTAVERIRAAIKAVTK